MTTHYLTCTETAVLVRAALKKAFPTTKFAVRSSTYSGGASIRVKWIDGPRTADVERIAGAFAGGSFDGMTDSMSHHAIQVDGEARRTQTDFVFCTRSVSGYEEKTSQAGAMIRARCAIMQGSVPSADRFGNDWVDNLACAMARDADPDGSLEGAFRRVVLRDE